MKQSVKPTVKRRIFELDLLRGFFICVIVLDHLQFWPSPFQYLTGQGRLWMTAAEGFFLISGLLIGYLRAYKGAKQPMKDLTKILLRRALTLYVWCVGITFIVYMLVSYLPNASSFLPAGPTSVSVTSLGTYVWSVISLRDVADWIYFLRLYAFMLIATPLLLYLIRIGKWWIGAAISIGIYGFGYSQYPGEMALQWQLLFFGAALLGWKLESILSWLRTHKEFRKYTLYSLVFLTISTMLLSYFMVHGWRYVEAPGTPLDRDTFIAARDVINPYFSNMPMEPMRMLLSFVWFGGLLSLFHLARSGLNKWLGWLLLPFGQSSLTVYCLHAVVLCFVVAYLPYEKNFWLNGLIGTVTLLLFVGLLRLKIVQKVLPR